MVSPQECSFHINPDFAQQLEDLQKTYECPITLTLLTEAVSLVPCMHKINLTVAKQLLGEIKNQTELSKPCPVCRQIVVAYYPDHHIREASQQISTLYQTYSHKTPKEDPWFLSFERKHKRQEKKIKLKKTVTHPSEQCFLKLVGTSEEDLIQEMKLDKISCSIRIKFKDQEVGVKYFKKWNLPIQDLKDGQGCLLKEQIFNLTVMIEDLNVSDEIKSHFNQFLQDS